MTGFEYTEELEPQSFRKLHVGTMGTDAVEKVAPTLPRLARGLAGVGGLAAVVFGVLAIFRAHDGAATAALLLVGAAFFLMAITGYAITKIKAGDYEITLDRVRQAQLAYAQGDEERAAAILESLIRFGVVQVPPRAHWLPPEDGRAAAAAAYQYERLVLEVIAAVLPPEARLTEHEAPLSGVDAFIEFPEGTRIGVEIRSGTRFDLRGVADRISGAVSFARPRISGLIFVVRTTPDDQRAAKLRTAIGKLQIPVEVAAWEPGQPENAIRNAVMNILPLVR